MAEIKGRWNGDPIELRLEGKRFSFVDAEGGERAALHITQHGPTARADGSILHVGNHRIDIEGPNAVGKAAGLAERIEDIRKSAAASTTPTTPRRPAPLPGPAPSTSGSPVMGAVLAIVGAAMMLLGAIAGGNLVSEANEEILFGNLNFAEAVTVFGGGASPWMIAGAVLLGSGLIVHRLDQVRA
ncbi:MAG: hypothetical protein AAFZ07_16515 [Actinomycetota bacterium]